jgi:hypothetical protein
MRPRDWAWIGLLALVCAGAMLALVGLGGGVSAQESPVATPTEWYDACPGPPVCEPEPTYTPAPVPTCRATPACEYTPYPTSTAWPPQPTWPEE